MWFFRRDHKDEIFRDNEAVCQHLIWKVSFDIPCILIFYSDSSPQNERYIYFPYCLSGRKKVVSTWNCSQQGLWIILCNWVMISEVLVLKCSNDFLYLEYHKPSAIWSHYIREKSDISTADISKTLQLTLKLGRWIYSATGKRKHSM